MTKAVVTCDPTDTIVTAARVMAHHQVGALIVLDANGALAGLVTCRDVCVAIGAEDLGRTVASVMTRGVIWVRPEQTAEAVGHLMANHHIHRVPVLSPDRVPIGMIALSDLALGACETGKRRDRVAIARTLAAIHAPRPQFCGDPKTLRD
ncbi:MAG: CBS domain-containing protein [Kofleriaceae bacterium]